MKKPSKIGILLSLLFFSSLMFSCSKEDPDLVPDKYLVVFNIVAPNGTNVFSPGAYDASDLKARNVLRTNLESNFVSMKKDGETYVVLATDYQEIPIEFEFKFDDRTSMSVFLEIEGPAGLENLHLQNWKFYAHDRLVNELRFTEDEKLLNDFKTHNKPPKNGLFGLIKVADKIVILNVPIR